MTEITHEIFREPLWMTPESDYEVKAFAFLGAHGVDLNSSLPGREFVDRWQALGESIYVIRLRMVERGACWDPMTREVRREAEPGKPTPCEL